MDSIKWNGPANQQQTGATHMIVLRGNGDSTRVLYFHDHQDPRLCALRAFAHAAHVAHAALVRACRSVYEYPGTTLSIWAKMLRIC